MSMVFADIRTQLAISSQSTVKKTIERKKAVELFTDRENFIGSHNEVETALDGDEDYDDEQCPHELSKPLDDDTLTTLHVEDDQDHDNNDLFPEIIDMNDDGDQELTDTNKEVDNSNDTSDAMPLRQYSFLSHNYRFLF